MSGKVYLVGAGPGDPGLLTLKGRACLEAADVVLYDRLVAPEVLAFARPGAQRIYVGKEVEGRAPALVPGIPGLPAGIPGAGPNRAPAPPDGGGRQAEIHRLMIAHAKAGRTVVRLKGGDPFVFGRGGEETAVLRRHGIPFEVVPGVSSAVAVPAYAGIPLTYRGVASGFHVVTGHEALHSAGVAWDVLAASAQTLVILMGLGHLGAIAQRLMAHGRGAETPVAVIASGTTPQQQTVIAPLCEIADAVDRAGIRAPAVIVVGEVARLAETLAWFERGGTPWAGFWSSDSGRAAPIT
ncbi:uroporphyrinogen-III C-methyltransferase [Alicyclobacillus macrosporangiidus]|uniref:uroporphyrinogen-III C-methyltransferase n=1 Tax=Alicyclobacillus macrosporangiidus TaxID=392015 RepID=UPI0009DFA331|nr:uroporphyrinogen-III C-methyltransferase [Alicyclobacillus macrosporangiidus]